MIDKNLKHVHLVGIKGVAMTALAILLKEAGVKVTGSDTGEVFVTDKILRQKKIKWSIGFKAENISGRPDLVIVTGAHEGLSNKEALAAQQKGLRVITHAEALGIFTKGNKVIGVCGVGGKSTTAAMIATILTKANLDPGYAIGVASINPLCAGGHYGLGEFFIAEADEYVTDPKNDLTPRFMWLFPRVIVITNIEYDHPDVYKNINQTKEAFLSFANKVPPDGFLVTNGDNENVREILPKIKRKFFTYGFGKNNDYRIIKVPREEKRLKAPRELSEEWELRDKDNLIGKLALKIPGKHNVSNATAAAVTCLNLGIPIDKIKSGVSAFLGTKRRFEFIAEVNGIKIYDDYAHHPSEILATLKTAREFFPKNRIISIFQPHTYSRTKALFFDFAKSFSDADRVIITDIYASARERPDESVSSEKLAVEVSKYHSNVKYIGKKNEVMDYLRETVKPNDIIFTMGAGDIFSYHPLIIKEISKVKK